MKDLISKKIAEWRTTGSIAPSSKFLVHKMISKIDFGNDLKILQLGYGNGVFTRKILPKMSSKSSLAVFEINKKCRKFLIKDPRLQYFEDSAENISAYFGTQKFDCIISTLPFASLPKQISKNIFEQIKTHLKRHGKFLQFQYSLYSKNDIAALFETKPQIHFEMMNLPPAFIYETENNLPSLKMNLEKMCQTKNLALSELSKKTKIAETNLTLLQKGKAKILNFKTLNKLCRELECLPKALFEYLEK